MGTTTHSRATWQWRRAALGGAVAAVVAFTPAIAQAAFLATAAGSLSTSTYTIPAPATVTRTNVCNYTKPYSSTLSISAYSKVARATAYQLTLTAPDGTSTTQTVTADSVSLTKSSTVRNGTYTFELAAVVGTWTGLAYRGTYNC